MAIARIDRKPEQLCVGDESQHLSDVVQNGLRTLRHRKDMRAKTEHPLHQGVRMPREFLSDENISIVAMVNFGINAS